MIVRPYPSSTSSQQWGQNDRLTECAICGSPNSTSPGYSPLYLAEASQEPLKWKQFHLLFFFYFFLSKQAILLILLSAYQDHLHGSIARPLFERTVLCGTCWPANYSHGLTQQGAERAGRYLKYNTSGQCRLQDAVGRWQKQHKGVRRYKSLWIKISFEKLAYTKQ